MLNVEQTGDEAVPTGLFDHAFARVDQDDGEVRGRRPGHHIAGVLDMPGSVCNDEFAAGCREVAVGDIDRDPLFPLGAQSVREQGEIDVFVAALTGGVLNRFELVLEDRLGVIHQSPDEGAFAVVNRSGSGEAKKFHGFSIKWREARSEKLRKCWGAAGAAGAAGGWRLAVGPSTGSGLKSGWQVLKTAI